MGYERSSSFPHPLPFTIQSHTFQPSQSSRSLPKADASKHSPPFYRVCMVQADDGDEDYDFEYEEDEDDEYMDGEEGGEGDLENQYYMAKSMSCPSYRTDKLGGLCRAASMETDHP